MNIVLRPYEKALDYGFIISTWPKAVYYGQKGHTHHSADEHRKWFEEKYNFINTMLDRWQVRIAADAEDPTFIVGYSLTTKQPNAAERSVLFVYVKKGYRCEGISRLLTGPEKQLDYKFTDWTAVGKIILEKRKKNENTESNAG